MDLGKQHFGYTWPFRSRDEAVHGSVGGDEEAGIRVLGRLGPDEGEEEGGRDGALGV